MKLLCLHGFAQSGEMFAKKASGLRKPLTKAGHDLLFISGPLVLTPNDLPFDPDPSQADIDMRAWWVVNEASPDYLKTEKAMETVRETLETKGPFDGIIGFSQGAGLTAALTKLIGSEQFCPNHPKIKFAIMFSSFKLNEKMFPGIYDEPFSTPSLHILGSLDTVVSEERSMQLYDAWEPSKRTLVKHPGGHYVPSAKPLVQQVLAFVSEQQETNNKQEEKKDDEDFSEFAKIGK